MGFTDLLGVLLTGRAPDASGGSDPPTDGETAFYECRHCGTTVESPDDPCPACDHEEIAEYTLE
ncbi:hypothetical protein ACYJ1Y_17905 [Natrialbaceae archaeon A-gly3]